MQEDTKVEWETSDDEDAIFTSKCGTFNLVEDAVYGILSLRLVEDGVYSLGETCSINGATSMANKFLQSWAANPETDPRAKIDIENPEF